MSNQVITELAEENYDLQQSLAFYRRLCAFAFLVWGATALIAMLLNVGPR